MVSYIPYIVALILAVNSASGLECYNCNSKDSTACSWGITSFTYNVEKCASFGPIDIAKCYKITAKNREGAEYIARGCMSGPSIACNAIAKTIGWFSEASSSDPDTVTDINCVTCETDKCNSASRIAGFSLLGLLLATFAFLF